jgi:predicted permease
VEVQEIYTQLGILFIVILVGYVLGKIKLLTPTATQIFSKYVLKVALPALLISGMMIPFSEEKLRTALFILLLSIPCYGLAYIVGRITAKILTKDIDEKAIYCFGIVFSNAGFLGFPVFQALYGTEALFYAAVYNIMFHIMLYTIGVVIMSSTKKGVTNKLDLTMLINPGVIASVAGFLLFITGITLPKYISGTIDSIGDSCVPISLLTIGAMLSELPVQRMFTNIRIYVLTVVRLIVLPLLTFVMLRYFFRLEEMWLIAIPVITAGMPVGTSAGLMTKEYAGDGSLASQTILISTIFSCITIPLLANFLQYSF